MFTARTHRLLLVTLAALLAAPLSCARRTARMGDKPSNPTIRFSHAKHALMSIKCDKCHGKIASATALTGKHNPTKAHCKACHNQVKQPSRCTMCHVGPGKLTGFVKRPPTPNLQFNHQAHLKRVKGCDTCHGAIMRGATLATLQRPRMKDCFGCHNHQRDYRVLKCGGCHKSLAEFPIKFVSAFRHEGDFLKEHGRRARSQTDLCRRCHTQSFCADCHSQRQVVLPGLKYMERADRQFIHRGDWLSRHPIEASGRAGMCVRCHSSKQCEKCHRSHGVAQRISGSKSKSRSPHPADWLNPMSPNNHGIRARRRITQCAACHDRGPQSNCIRCHSSVARGGLGINPHPPGFDRGGKQQHRVCKLCH